MPTVLYIGQNPAAGTGSPIVVLRHLRRFAQEGWKVEVLADYGGDYRECLAAGWTVRPLRHRRWWWPPFRPHSPALRWLRLKLLAWDVAAGLAAPDVILGYLAAHADFPAQLAVHVAQTIGAPLHLLVHDDAAAFPGAHGRQVAIRRTHESIMRGADTCWFVSSELADLFAIQPAHRRTLYPLPEGWTKPAVWRPEFATSPSVYYAGHVWPEQIPLLSRIGDRADRAGADLVIMSQGDPGVHALCNSGAVRWHAPFPTNREALAHLSASAAGVLVSYADAVDDMPWCATSFPSKLVEYVHLGLPIAIVAPAGSAVGRWAQRHSFPSWFEPADELRQRQWFEGLRQRETWEEQAAVSRRLAHTEFDAGKIHAELANAIVAGTEWRAA